VPGYSLPLMFPGAGKVIACGGSDGSLIVVGLDTGARLSPLSHGEAIHLVRFSASSRLVLTASDKSVCLWDLKAAGGVPRFSFDVEACPRDACFDASQSRLVVSGADGLVYLWDLTLEASVPPLAIDGGFGFSCARFFLSDHPSAEGLLVTSERGGVTRVWDLGPSPRRRKKGGAVEGREEGEWTPVWEAPPAACHRGQDVVLLATSCPGGGLKVSAGASAPNLLVATAAADGVANLLDARNHVHLVRFQLGTNLTSVALSPGGSRMFLGDDRGTLVVMDTRRAEALYSVTCASAPVRGIDVSPAIKTDSEGEVSASAILSGSDVDRAITRNPTEASRVHSPPRAEAPSRRNTPSAAASLSSLSGFPTGEEDSRADLLPVKGARQPPADSHTGGPIPRQPADVAPATKHPSPSVEPTAPKEQQRDKPAPKQPSLEPTAPKEQQRDKPAPKQPSLEPTAPKEQQRDKPAPKQPSLEPTAPKEQQRDKPAPKQPSLEPTAPKEQQRDKTAPTHSLSDTVGFVPAPALPPSPPPPAALSSEDVEVAIGRALDASLERALEASLRPMRDLVRGVQVEVVRQGHMTRQAMEELIRTQEEQIRELQAAVHRLEASVRESRSVY
jgi:WD40 repeat protein